MIINVGQSTDGCWSNSFIRNGHSSRIKILLSRNFRELHVYLSRGPLLANNTSYEDSFTTCQITPENHGSLLGSLLNMQLASRNPFSGQIFFCKVYWPTPFNMHFDFRPLFRITFAELREISLFTDPGHQQGVHWRKSEDQGPWCLALAKPHFWKLGYCYSHSLVPFSCRTLGGSGWQPFTYNDYNTQLSRNFREIKFYFRELEKKLSRGFPT